MRRVAVLVGCVVVALLVAWYAGSRPVQQPLPPAGSVRLGPEAGEQVRAYVARIAAELPPPGERALALVQLDREVPVAEAAALAPVLAVYRAPGTGPQPALRFEQLEPGVEPGRALASAQERAQRAAADAAAQLTGRLRDAAAAEAAALADPGCACVLAVVVDGDRARLVELAGQVRAVHAAPPGVTLRELALSPLLPEQADVVGPAPG